MLHQSYYDNWSIFCRYTICYHSSIMIFGAYCVGKVRYTICYLDGIMIIGAYCVGKVHNMLPQ